jgi:hypothetical protein
MSAGEVAGGDAGAGEICWDGVSRILQRETCTMLYFEMLDANHRRCNGAKAAQGDALPPSCLVIWVVSPSGQVTWMVASVVLL